MDSKETDLATGFLSDKDREGFLHSVGLTESLSAQEAQAIRDEWPDTLILMTIGAGLY